MNKSVILLIAFLVVTTWTRAQTSAGNMMLGGAIEFSSTSREGGSPNDGSSFSFSPDFGYFITDNFAVGAMLTLESSRQGTGDAKTTSSGFGIGPFARYYVFTSNEQFGFFGQARLSFGTERTDPAFGNRHGAENQPGKSDPPQESQHYHVGDGVGLALPQHALAGLQCLDQQPPQACRKQRRSNFIHAHAGWSRQRRKTFDSGTAKEG